MKFNRLLTFVHANRAVVGVLLISGLIFFWFIGKLIASFVYFNDPQHTDVELKRWMTPRYIALTYDLPRPIVLDILALPTDFTGGIRLSSVADDLGLDMDQLTLRVRTAADKYRSISND